MVAMRWGAVSAGQPDTPPASGPAASRATSPATARPSVGAARATSPGAARATSPGAARATSPGAARATSPGARRGSIGSVTSSGTVEEKPPVERRNFTPLKKEDLTIGEVIGKGRFKSVVRGLLRCEDEEEEPRDVVVLEYVKSEQRRELSILALLANSPLSPVAVPAVHGAIDDGKKVLVVQERAVLGSMKGVITDAEMVAKLTARHRLYACAQFAQAMVFLTSVRVVHADLSCRNILLCKFDEDAPEQTSVKVTDFGLAVVLKEGTDHECRKQPQATRWSAPETVADSKFSFRSDVWSMGTTLWEFYSNGENPWVRWQKRNNVAARLKALQEGVAKGKVDPDGVDADFFAPEGCSPAAHAVILSCLRVDEKVRPSFEQLAEDFERIATDPKEFPELASPEEEEAEADEQEGEVGDCEAEAPCDTSGFPSEADPASNDITFDAPKVARAEGVSTPSTSATPSVPTLASVPWWAADHLDAPSELFSGPKAHLFAEALKEFLHSERVKDLVGDKAGLDALKEFLCLPHALDLLTAEAKEDSFADYVRQRTPMMESREPPMQEVFSLGSRARRSSAPPQRPQFMEPVADGPVSDSLVPLSGMGLQAEPHRMQHGGLWTVLSLVSPVLLRRREFMSEAAAWVAFRACGASPCMLRDPRGADVASQSWLVVGSQSSPPVYGRLASPMPTLPPAPMVAWL